MISRTVLAGLVFVAMIAPMVVLVLLGVGKLLAAMGDTTGAVWLERLALVGGVGWGIDLVLLLVALGVNATFRLE